MHIYFYMYTCVCIYKYVYVCVYKDIKSFQMLGPSGHPDAAGELELHRVLPTYRPKTAGFSVHSGPGEVLKLEVPCPDFSTSSRAQLPTRMTPNRAIPRDQHSSLRICGFDSRWRGSDLHHVDCCVNKKSDMAVCINWGSVLLVSFDPYDLGVY